MTVPVDISPLPVPAFNRLNRLNDEDEARRLRLISRLHTVKRANLRQAAYYEGAHVVRDLGIAIPPHLRDLEAVAGWPEIIVDVIDERMDWHGWRVGSGAADGTSGAANLGLDEIAAANHLGVEIGQVVVDALICGVGFLVAGTGDTAAGEPDILVTAESPTRMTGTWSPRLRRLTEALVELYDERGALIGWQLYTPNKTIRTERRDRGVVVVDRDQHGAGRVPVVMLRNRPRASRQDGRSEITKAVRAITDSGVRTLLGLEVSREFYAAPQRYLMGADEAMFVGPDGEKRSQWDAMLSHMLSIPRDEDGDIPVAGQFPAQTPTAFTEQLRTYAQMISAVSGVPSTHLGFVTDNPASADAIREANTRLDKRAIRRQGQFNLGLIELGEVAVLWRDGTAPPPGLVRSAWGDPSTPTPAASADRVVKLVQSRLLPADSDVALEQAGLNPEDIARVAVDRRRARARETARALAAGAAGARTDPAVADLAARTGADPGPAAAGGAPGGAGADAR